MFYFWKILLGKMAIKWIRILAILVVPKTLQHYITGPSTWGDYCKGSSQTPINIVSIVSIISIVTGPSTWGDYCKGSSQTPINIVTCESERSSFDNRIFSHNYWKAAGKRNHWWKSFQRNFRFPLSSKKKTFLYKSPKILKNVEKYP